MAKVKQQFTGDAKQLLAEYEKMRVQMSKLEDGQRKLLDESKNAHKAMRNASRERDQWIQNQAKAAGQLLFGFASVQQGIGKIVDAYRTWDSEATKLGEKVTQINQRMIGELAEAGDLLYGTQIRAELAAMPQVTREQGMDLFSGVTAGNPTAPYEARLALTKAAQSQAFTGVDLEQLGLAVGKGSKFLTEDTADDIVDIVVKTRAMAGAEIKKIGEGTFFREIGTLQERGLGADLSIALATTALQKNMETETLNQIAGVIGQSIEIVTKPDMTAADILKNQFAAMGPEQRLAALLSDTETAQTMLGREASTKLSLLSLEEVRANEREIQLAQSQDYAQEIVKQAQAAFPELSAQQVNDAMNDKLLRSHELREAQRTRLIDFVSAQTHDDDIFTSMMSRTRASGFRRILHQDMENIIGNAVAEGAIDPSAADTFLRNEEKASRMIDQLERQTQALERMAENSTAPINPSTHTENE